MNITDIDQKIIYSQKVIKCNRPLRLNNILSDNTFKGTTLDFAIYVNVFLPEARKRKEEKYAPPPMEHGLLNRANYNLYECMSYLMT